MCFLWICATIECALGRGGKGREGCSRSMDQKKKRHRPKIAPKTCTLCPSCTPTDASLSYFCSSPHPFLLTFGGKGGKKEAENKQTAVNVYCRTRTRTRTQLVRQQTAVLFAIEDSQHGLDINTRLRLLESHLPVRIEIKSSHQHATPSFLLSLIAFTTLYPRHFERDRSLLFFDLFCFPHQSHISLLVSHLFVHK